MWFVRAMETARKLIAYESYKAQGPAINYYEITAMNDRIAGMVAIRHAACPGLRWPGLAAWPRPSLAGVCLRGHPAGLPAFALQVAKLGSFQP
jgi:hypothetical protein